MGVFFSSAGVLFKSSQGAFPRKIQAHTVWQGTHETRGVGIGKLASLQVTVFGGFDTS